MREFKTRTLRPHDFTCESAAGRSAKALHIVAETAKVLQLNDIIMKHERPLAAEGFKRASQSALFARDAEEPEGDLMPATVLLQRRDKGSVNTMTRRFGRGRDRDMATQREWTTDDQTIIERGSTPIEKSFICSDASQESSE